MTKANRERLYAHYMEIGYKSAAENMLAKDPSLAKPVVKEKAKSTSA